MKKNRLMVLTFLFMALGILFGSTSVRAADTYYTTDDGNYTFEVEEDGTANLHRYVGTETDVTVPATITGNGQTYEVSILGSHAFHQREDVLNVIVSEGIKEIQTGAFYYCSNLKTVKVPSTAKFYDAANNAFIGTDSLEYIDVDDDNPMYFDIDGVCYYHSVKDYEHIVMERYPSAKPDTTYVIPEEVDYIYFDMFQNTKYLQKLVFPRHMRTDISAAGVTAGAVVNPLNSIEIYLPTTDLTAYDDKCFNKLPAGSKVYVQTDALAEEAVRLLVNSPDAEIVSLESNPEAGMPCTSLTFADGSTEKEIDTERTTSYQIEWTMSPYGATDALTWASSDTDIATVDALSGLVECVNEGTAVITGTDQHGHSISLTVNVYVDVTEIYIERDVSEEDIMDFYSDGGNWGEGLYVDIATDDGERYYGEGKVEIVISNPDILQIEYDGGYYDYAMFNVIPLGVGTVTIYAQITDYDGTVYTSNEITYVIKEDISEWYIVEPDVIELLDYGYLTESALFPGIEVWVSGYTYTGAEIKPKMVLKDHSGKTLIERTDYIVECTGDNVNVGTVEFTVKGIGYYEGEFDCDFEIIAKDLSDFTVTRNGNTFTVQDGETVLTEGVDYTCTINYTDNTNKYITSVNIVGKGNYKGSITKYYNDTPGSDSGNTGGSTDNSDDNSNTNTDESADNGSDSAGNNNDTNNDSTTNGSTDNSSNNGESTDKNSQKDNTKKSQTITGNEARTAVYRKNGSLFLNCRAKTTLTYTSSNTKVATVNSKGKVTIKGTGICTITVTAGGTDKYEAATKTITIKITPKKATLSKAKSSRKKTITVTWKKDSQASGYEIQYSTNKSFKKAKTVTVSGKKKSATIKKLKAGKKYYVRIRSYKTVKVDGKTEKLYGSYSGKKSIKVKK